VIGLGRERRVDLRAGTPASGPGRRRGGWPWAERAARDRAGSAGLSGVRAEPATGTMVAASWWAALGMGW
jgi:hypothetical protein